MVSNSSPAGIRLFVPLSCGFLLCMAGCGAGGESADAPRNSNGSGVEAASPEGAIRHYINGSVHENTGEYALAIREYKAALAFDSSASIHAALARNYRLTHDPASAVEHGARAVALAPDNAAYRELLCEAYIANRQLDSAAAQYEILRRTQPSKSEYEYVLARLYQETHPERALALYQEMLDRTGGDWDVLLRMAETLASLGHLEKAVSMLERLRAIEPDNEDLLQNIAVIYTALEQHDTAASVYDDLASRFPGHTGYLVLAADNWRRHGDWPRASARLRSAFDADSLDAESAMQAGDICFQRALIDSALADSALATFALLKSRYPEDWRPFWFTGALLFNRGDVQRCIPEISRATDLEPRNAQAYDVLARAYLSLERYGEAIKPLQILVNRNAATAETYAFMGFAYSRLGKDSLAIDALQQALRLDPKRIDALGTLALTLDGRKEYTRSDELYTFALTAFENGDMPKDDAYYLLLNNFAYALSERGEQLERAADMARQALVHDSSNTSYLDTFGWVSFKRGDYENALDHILRAVQTSRDSGRKPSPVVLEHLGDVYHKLGKPDRALHSWEEAIEQNPANKTLEEKIRSLRP